MNRFDDLDLAEPVAAAVVQVVERICEQLKLMLREAGIDEPICSVCIDQGQERDLEVLPRVFAGRAIDRNRIACQATPGDWVAVWNPYAYRDEDDVVHPVVDDEGTEKFATLDDEHQKAWVLVRDALDGRVFEPSEWLLARVARRLNRAELRAPVTADVAVWVFDESFGQGSLLEQLTFVLRSETFTALEAAGHIGPDEESAEREHS